ncbi:GNAT family N-acetyltransferase [Savagea faecisuis]|uniref:GNAT family N-acetyltransferase n=1 Tax=Savagea faecisuis TaxID=1274803 RepID=A0ABW3GX68_9BACL
MVEIKEGKQRFYVGDSESDNIAEIHYVPTGKDRIIVDHTFVSDELRGQGVGELLVERIVHYARETNKKIIPLCPFAKQQIDANPNYHDIL